MAKVSVIVPYLKGPVYLEECIESIEQQNLTDFEVLIISDKDGHEVPTQVMNNPHVKVFYAVNELPEDVIRANEEASAEIKEKRIQKHVEKRLTRAEKRRQEVEQHAEKGEELKIYTEKELFPEEEDLIDEYEEKIDQVNPFGVGHCRNIGIQKATGKYIYFIDADDYLRLDALKKLVNLAEEKKSLVTTGNKWSSWFRPSSFDFEKAAQETFIEGVHRLRGETLQKRFIENFSAQHLLIDRQFVIENQVAFDSENTYYSDVNFVVQILHLASENMWVDGDSLYIWRHRNDRIHLPALCQKRRAKRGREFIDAYEHARATLTKEDQSLIFALDRTVVHFALSKFPLRIKGETALRYTKAMRSMPEWKKLMKDFHLCDRTELAIIRKGKYRMVKPVVRFSKWKRKKKGFFGNRIQWFRVLEKKIFKKMSIRRDWVMLESFFGKSYSDSPKYLYEYLQKTRGDKYRYIWVLNQKSDDLNKTGKHTVCKMNSLRYVYYAARSGYRIFNVRQPAWCKKRVGIVFLETWHGTPLKRLAFDLDDLHAASQNHKTLFYQQGREWNYLVSANRFSTDVFERAFVYNRDKILEYGYPRNDILYAENKEQIAVDVKKEFGIPSDKRVILYAPTWRDNQFYAKGRYKFTLALDLERMKKEFGEDSIILLRTHYYIADIVDLSAYEGFVFNGSKYEDVSRLYLASDICITDYSSVFFDFANLKRPILFYTYDYNAYADEIRGLYIDMEKELPGPILQTNDEVVDALHNMDAITEKYSERYAEFYERFCNVDDGHASERIIEKVFGEREQGLRGQN